MLTPDTLLRLEAYSGGINRSQLADPDDDSRDYQKVVDAINKVIGKAKGSVDPDEPKLQRMRKRTKTKTMRGSPLRATAQNTDTPDFS